MASGGMDAPAGKYKGYVKELYVCYIDLRKVFDSVRKKAY